MYCPVESKKSKLESCCIICSQYSYSADNGGELTSIFLYYLFPPADKEEITIKLLRFFTFCRNCASILDELIELHKNLECIKYDIKNTVNTIKCSILKNRDDEKVTDVNVQKLRKIATRDYCPKVVLENADAFFSKGENNSEIQMANNADAQYAQLERSLIMIKDGCQTSMDIFKSLNTNTGDIPRNSLESSKSNATLLSPTLTSFSTNFVDTAGYNEENVRPNSEYNEIANGQEFSGLQSRNTPEVTIEMESNNFDFAVEEGPVQFETWDQIIQEESDNSLQLQHTSPHEQNVISENLQENHCDDHNGSNRLQLQQSQIIGESQSELTNKYPTLSADLNMPCGVKSLDPEDSTINKSILWTRPDALSPQNMTIARAENLTCHEDVTTHSTSDYMINSGFSKRAFLGNEYEVTLATATSPPTVNCSNAKLITKNKGEEMVPQQKEVIQTVILEDDSAEKLEEVTEPLVSSTTVELKYQRKTFDHPPLSHPILAAIVVANSDKNGLTCPAICELMWKRFPFYEDQKDPLPKRLYATLKKSQFFVQKYHGGLPFSLFYLNTANKEAMKDLKEELHRFLIMNPEHIYQCTSNPNELEAMARNILGTDFDCDLAENLQRLRNYVSQIQML